MNYRDNSIPAAIIQANRTAHAAIEAYDQQQGVTGSPWPFYKLGNVQYTPGGQGRLPSAWASGEVARGRDVRSGDP